MRIHPSGLFALLFVTGSVCAESLPKDGRFDARIKEVAYNVADVVKVIGHYGYSTDIEFSPGELTENIALGDSLAWQVAPAANHLFVKPSQDNAVTNMTVVTNKHVYQMSLDARTSKGATSGRTKGMYFQVRYSYPEEGTYSQKQANERLVQAELEKFPDARDRNWNYYGCGSRQMLPSEVFDDGRFTYMRFPAAQEMPAVFIIGTDGTESIVNGSMHGEYYVAQRTALRFVLRRGKAVSCVENRSYNPYGVASPTGTSSSDVKRTLKRTPDAGSPAATVPPTTPTNHSEGRGAQGQPLPQPYDSDGKPQTGGKNGANNPFGGMPR